MAEIPERDGLKPGDVAIVTGAGLGIGRGVALRLARDGAKVAVWDVVDENGAETVRQLEEAGAQAFYHHADVGDEAEVVAATAATVEALGAPYALVNNAGIHPRAPLLEMELSLWEQVIRTNLTGHFLCTKTIAPHMVTAGRGAIVNTASGRALHGAVRGAHYAASKGGVVNFTKTSALELAGHGIRVNCVIPGVSETAQPLEDTTLEELLERGKRIPLGRIGQPDDIAAVVSFLLSSDAGYMTGQSVACNGGTIMVP
jgi:NAD(P)-dependent dehydrogenase (short-subunit alcohol dehydrogenase family)